MSQSLSPHFAILLDVNMFAGLEGINVVVWKLHTKFRLVVSILIANDCEYESQSMQVAH